jgi:hypothetical protein
MGLMAIDTAAKRASCLGLAFLALRTGVIPDGSNLGASQRLHTQGLYSGIAAGVIVTVDPDAVIITVGARGRIIDVQAIGRFMDVDALGRTIEIGDKT